MKKIIFTIAFAGITLVSCKKAESSTEKAVASPQAESKEISNVQNTKTFKNSKGDILKVTYFAEGADVVVKIQRNSEPEQKLMAKTVNSNGNPVFTNEIYMWEMKEGGAGGKLSDKDGNAIEYLAETVE